MTDRIERIEVCGCNDCPLRNLADDTARCGITGRNITSTYGKGYSEMPFDCPLQKKNLLIVKWEDKNA